MKDCLNTCFELVKLVNFSPKQVALLNLIDASSIHAISPTRWTVCAECASIIDDYTDLQSLWERELQILK